MCGAVLAKFCTGLNHRHTENVVQVIRHHTTDSHIEKKLLMLINM